MTGLPRNEARQFPCPECGNYHSPCFYRSLAREQTERERADRYEQCDCVPCIVSSFACPKCGRRAVANESMLEEHVKLRERAERVLREKGEAEELLGMIGAGGTPAGLVGATHNLIAMYEQQRERRERAEAALAELLRLAEREHGKGFFRPEEWYAARDEARHIVALSTREPGKEAEA